MNLWFKTLLITLCIFTFSQSSYVRAALTVTQLDLYGAPGAPITEIQNNFLTSETALSHHDIVIVEGGINCIWWGQTSATLTAALQALANRAASNHSTMIVQGLLPLIPEIADNYGAPYGPPYVTRPNMPKALALNAAAALFASNQSLAFINTFDAFLPHWTEDADTWCLWEFSDSIHPNATGVDNLARMWAEAIYATGLDGPKTVGVYGDSIVAGAYLPTSERPAARLAYWISVTPVELSKFSLD